VANDCLKIFKQKNVDERMGKLWQRKYYEHIIGDEQSYQRISEYIINNPKNWKEDQLYNQI
jgi:REP element-mobilizing transposase RayT